MCLRLTCVLLLNVFKANLILLLNVFKANVCTVTECV